jgi:hypothetical protein
LLSPTSLLALLAPLSLLLLLLLQFLCYRPFPYTRPLAWKKRRGRCLFVRSFSNQLPLPHGVLPYEWRFLPWRPIVSKGCCIPATPATDTSRGVTAAKTTSSIETAPTSPILHHRLFWRLLNSLTWSL